MKVWLPSIDKKGHTLLELKNDFSFEYIDHNIESGKLEIMVVGVGALTDCRFQILFELAVIHLANGQYRDAVVAAHTALERYREFFILAAFIDQGFDNTAIKEFWSSIGNQSERQLGAYHAMMFLNHKSIAKDLSSKNVEYRNKVVHQGFFPDEKNTHKYCLATLNIIEKGLTILASVNNEILMTAMQCEYINRKPTEVTIPLSINPLLNFENLKQDGWTDSFNSRLKELGKTTFYEVTWPNHT